MRQSAWRLISRARPSIACLRRRRRSWRLFKQVLLDQINGIFPRKANKNGYEVAFANPENNKTGLLDGDLLRKIH